MNDLNQTTTPTPAVSAIHKGLTSLGQSAHRIAGYIRANPGELQAATESGRALQEQFGKLLESVEKFAGSANELRLTTEETTKAADWIGNKYPASVPVGNHTVGRVCDF